MREPLNTLTQTHSHFKLQVVTAGSWADSWMHSCSAAVRYGQYLTPCLECSFYLSCSVFRLIVWVNLDYFYTMIRLLVGVTLCIMFRVFIWNFRGFKFWLDCFFRRRALPKQISLKLLIWLSCDMIASIVEHSLNIYGIHQNC